MEDKITIWNADDEIIEEDLTLDDLDGVAGGRTKVCIQYTTRNRDGSKSIHKYWKWEENVTPGERNRIVARQEYDD